MLPSKAQEPVVSDACVAGDAETDMDTGDRHRLLHQSRKT
jgi:hypothetical protein